MSPYCCGFEYLNGAKKDTSATAIAVCSSTPKFSLVPDALKNEKPIGLSAGASGYSGFVCIS